jgi:hypothetical protein
MSSLHVALIESDEGGTRLLGRTTDPDLVDRVRGCLAAERRRELAELEGPVRLVRPAEPEPSEH